MRRRKRRLLSYRALCEQHAAYGYPAQRRPPSRFIAADTEELKELERRIIAERSVLEYEV